MCISGLFIMKKSQLQISEMLTKKMQNDVLCKVMINEVLQDAWYKYICTSCYSNLQVVENQMHCLCPRSVPYADKW